MERRAAGTVLQAWQLWECGSCSTVREGAGLTQAELARKLRVTRSCLCDLEKDRKTVSPSHAVQFAHALGSADRQYVRLAIQDALRHAGLSYTVEIRAA